MPAPRPSYLSVRYAPHALGCNNFRDAAEVTTADARRIIEAMRRLLLALGLILIAAAAHAQDPALGEKPQHPPAPVPAAAPPDVHTLMLEVERNQQAAESVARDYTYHLHMKNVELSSSGAVKKIVETDADSFTIDGVRVNKVYARDGKPLTPEEAKKEDEAVDKTVARAKQHREQHEAKGQPTDPQGDVFIPASRILELGTFSNLRAGTYEGRPVWLVDYQGDPHAKTQNEFESVIRCLTGTAWIDQKDRVLVAAHGEFSKEFRIGFGLLVDIRKGTHFDYRATKVRNEIWLLQSFDAEGSLHYLVLGGFTGRIHVEASDYKKFQTSMVTLGGSQPVDDQGRPLPQTPPAAPPQP